MGIQSSLYQYILVSLLGLSDIQLRDRIYFSKSEEEHKENGDNDNDDNDDDDGIPKHYNDGLIKYNPSICEKPAPFNAAKDANQISSWIKDFDTKKDKNALKERLANILTSRNAKQRGLILAKYPKAMEDITKKIEKRSCHNNL